MERDGSVATVLYDVLLWTDGERRLTQVGSELPLGSEERHINNKKPRKDGVFLLAVPEASI